jgi:hypothetical protein
MGKEIQTSTGRLWFDETLKMVRFDYARGSVTTIVQARENIKAIQLLTEGKLHPFLCDITKCKSVDREARALFAGAESRSTYTSVALLSKTPIGNIIGNFFISLYGYAHVPTRLFTSEREAIAWLKGFIKE